MFGNLVSPRPAAPPNADEGLSRPRWTVPSHRGIVHHDAFATALTQVLGAVAAGRCVVLVGEPGAGKTTLLRELQRTLLAAGSAVHVAGTGPADADAVLLVDDADRAEQATEAKFHPRPNGSVLAGGPGLLDAMPRGRRKVATVTLALISPEHTAGFLRAFLQYTDDSLRPISATAIVALTELGKGRPGTLAELLQLAAFLTRLEGGVMIQVQHVLQAASCSAEEPEADMAPVAVPMVATSAALQARKRPVALLICAAALAAMALPASLAPGEKGDPNPFEPVAPVVEPAVAVPVVVAALPPVALAPAPPALPGVGQVMLTVLAGPDDRQAQARGAAIIAMLRGSGYQVGDLQASTVRTASLAHLIHRVAAAG